MELPPNIINKILQELDAAPDSKFIAQDPNQTPAAET